MTHITNNTHILFTMASHVHENNFQIVEHSTNYNTHFLINAMHAIYNFQPNKTHICLLMIIVYIYNKIKQCPQFLDFCSNIYLIIKDVRIFVDRGLKYLLTFFSIPQIKTNNDEHVNDIMKKINELQEDSVEIKRNNNEHVNNIMKKINELQKDSVQIKTNYNEHVNNIMKKINEHCSDNNKQFDDIINKIDKLQNNNKHILEQHNNLILQNTDSVVFSCFVNKKDEPIHQKLPYIATVWVNELSLEYNGLRRVKNNIIPFSLNPIKHFVHLTKLEIYISMLILYEPNTNNDLYEPIKYCQQLEHFTIAPTKVRGSSGHVMCQGIDLHMHDLKYLNDMHKLKYILIHSAKTLENVDEIYQLKSLESVSFTDCLNVQLKPSFKKTFAINKYSNTISANIVK